MKNIGWNVLKNERLKKIRGASFEDLLNSKLIGIKQHPSKPEQKIMLFEYKRYMWIIPFVETNGEIFLKTLYSSRKYTKLYRREK